MNECYGRKCQKCKNLHHFAKFCRSVKQITSKNTSLDYSSYSSSEYDSDSDNNYRIEYIAKINLVQKSDWNVNLKFENQASINFKLDSGAEINALPAKFLKSLDLHKNNLLPSNLKISTYTGTKIDILGKCSLLCEYKNFTDYITFYIVNNEFSPAVLDKDECERLNLLNFVGSVKTDEKIKNKYKKSENSCKNQNINYSKISEKYKDVFEGLGTLKCQKYHINIDSSVRPVINAPRKIPFAMQDKLKSLLKDLEKKQIIAKVNEPTEWVNSLVLVHKPSGHF